MYFWLDDERPSPRGFVGVNSVNELKKMVEALELQGIEFFYFDLDHDLGEFAEDGGDGRKFVIWLIETGRNNCHYVVRCHSANPVGREYIESMVERYWI